MPINVTPLYDWIIVKRVTKNVTAGGLHIPDSVNDTAQRATVLAVGEGRLLPSGEVRPLRVAAGNTVLLGQWGGVQIDVDGEQVLFMKEEQVLAIVNP